MSFRNLIEQRLRAYDPDLDLSDPRLVREVIDPLVTASGDELPQADPRRLMQARLGEAFPDLDGTVFADLFGKAAGSLFAILRTELAATRARRRLDDERLLTGSDLADMRDVFLVDPIEGQFSRGLLRAFFTSPRSLSLDLGTQVVVSGRDGGPPRIYRPTFPQTFSVAEMRGNREGGQFFVDVDVLATETGEYYDLQPNEALGASGIAGAVRSVNLVPFRGGREGDNASRLLARIRTAVRARDASSQAGAEVLLPQIGVFDFSIVQGGDPLMVRDRIYGPNSIAGIPGGWRLPSSNQHGFVQLGIASDVWHAVPDEATSGTQVRSVVDEGVEVLVGNAASVSFTPNPAPNQVGVFQVTMPSDQLVEQIGVPELFPSSVPAPRPIVQGDIVYLGGVLTPFGTRIALEVAAPPLNTGMILRVVDPSEDPDTAFLRGTTPISVRRKAIAYRAAFPYAQAEPLFTQPFVAVPLFDTRALSPEGEEITAQGQPALVVPGTTRAESLTGTVVPQTRNVVQSVAEFPLASVERLELLDAITGQPSREYVYPRVPLYCEYQETRAGTLLNKFTRLRVHLLGPQATALGRVEVTDFPDGSNSRMTPLYWGPIAASVDTDGARVMLADPPGELGLPGNTIAGRVPRAGDWVHFYTTGVSIFLPIETVLTPTLFQLAAADLPLTTNGHVVILQGASRASLLSQSGFASSRGPEGTYSFDVWLRELRAWEVPGYVPKEAPLLGTLAHVPEAGWLSQGFELVSCLSGQQFSTQERASLCIQGSHVVDRQEVLGRSFVIHAYPGNTTRAVQDVFDRDGRLIKTSLAKAYAPAFLVCSFFYDAEDLAPEDAARAVLEEVRRSQEDQRVELSDLKDSILRAGADFVVSGRLFVLRQDHNRRWTYTSTRGAVPLLNIGQLRLSAVTCTRLRRRVRGENLDEFSPSSWAAPPFTLRPGGFDAD